MEANECNRCGWLGKKPCRPPKIGRRAGGEGGIRTLGTLTRTTVFETAPFDRSGTSPLVRLKPREGAIQGRRGH